MPPRSLALAVLLVAALFTPTAAANSFRTDGTPYQAETLWSAKRAVGVDDFVLYGREPWSREPAGRDVTVGIVDTGVDPGHPDLQDQIAGWRDFTGGPGDGSVRPYDDQGHGTHIAGVIAGSGHLEANPLSPYPFTGVRGIAPEAELLIAKAIGEDGTGDDALVAQAIRWLVDPDGDGDLGDGADVINLSLGIGAPEDGMGTRENLGSQTRQAVEEAIQQGVVVVVSSGNEGMNTVKDPGDLAPVITVAATDGTGAVADFSNYGRYLDVAAPGVLVSTYPAHLDTRDGSRDGYVGMAGTSMAAPVVTGMVALMMEAHPGLANKDTRNDLTSKVDRVETEVRTHATPPDGAGERASFGVVDAHASLMSVDRGADGLDWRAVAVLAVAALLAARGGLAVRDALSGRTPTGGREPPEPDAKAETEPASGEKVR